MAWIGVNFRDGLNNCSDSLLVLIPAWRETVIVGKEEIGVGVL
jgi:hypothetical protein